MKKLFGYFLAFCCIALVAACGSGGSSGPTTGSLTVINNKTVLSITAVNISPTSQSTWGANQISASIPPNGGLRIITNIPAGSYDIRYTFSDSTTFTSPTTLIVTGGGTYLRAISKVAAKVAEDDAPANGSTTGSDSETFNTSTAPGDAK